MKTINLRKTILLILLVAGIVVTQAQVTIGSGNPPISGALLDLKEYGPSDPEWASGISATKGLGLPRVNLKLSNSLLPMFDAVSGSNYIKDGQNYDITTQNKQHVGLTVYNLTVDPVENFELGVYFWDGDKWNLAGRRNGPMDERLKFFYMPTFVLDVTGAVGTQKTKNLYSEYASQFSNIPSTRRNPDAGPNIPIFAANELNYYILGFDDKALKIISITDAGLLTYEIVAPATGITYINVAFTVK